MGESVSLVNGNGVGDTVSGIEDDTGSSTGSVERQDGLDGDVESGSVEGLEHDLSHLFSVDLGVERRFGEEDGVLLGGYSELVVELQTRKNERRRGNTRRRRLTVWCQIFSMSSQLVTIPCSMGSGGGGGA